MFPNGDYSPKCALCKGADNTATHWYDCPALQEVWREELAIADKRAPLRGDSKWQEIANQEAQAQGLVPRLARLEVSWQKAAGEVVQASHRTWRRRDELWMGLHKQGLAGPSPWEWMLGQHHIHHPPPTTVTTSQLHTRAQWVAM